MPTVKALWRSYLIWIIGALFYGYEVCLQISPSVMIPDLMKAFHIDGQTVGNLAAFYFYAYTVMQIPSGLLLDKFGPRKMMLTAFLLCAFGAFIFATAYHLHQAQLGRFIIGLGSSFAIVGTFKIISIWFPARKFALMSALTVTMGMTGAIGAGTPLALLVKAVGWRYSILAFAIAGLVLFCFAWFLLLEKSDKTSEKIQTITHASQHISVWKALMKVMSKKQNWIVACYGGLMFAPTSAFAGLWGVCFLTSAYGVSQALAGSAISMVFLGWIIGGPFFGKISDALQSRRATLLYAALGSFLFFYLTIYDIGTFCYVFVWLFLFGFFSSAFLPSFSIIQEINSSQTNATALGYMNTMNMVGGAALQPAIGICLDQHWQGRTIDSVRFYTLSNFQSSLKIILVMFALAAILYFFIEEPKKKQP